MKLTTMQRDAILAGLRLLQRSLDRPGRYPMDPAIETILTDGGTAITSGGIDALCDRLNGGGQ